MGLFSKIFKGFKSAVKKVVKGVKKVVKKVAKNKAIGLVAGLALGVAMPGLIPSIGGWLTSLPVVGPAFSAIGTGLNIVGQTVMGGIQGAYKGTEAFRGWFSNAFPKMSQTFRILSDTVMEGVNWVSNRIRGLQEVDTSTVRRMTLEGDLITGPASNGLVAAPDVAFRGVSEAGELIASQQSVSETMISKVSELANAKISEGINNILRQQQAGQIDPMALEDLEPTMAPEFVSTPTVTGRTAYGDPLSNEFLSQSIQNIRQDIPYLPDQSFSAGYEEFMNNTVWSFQQEENVREGVTTSRKFSEPERTVGGVPSPMLLNPQNSPLLFN